MDMTTKRNPCTAIHEICCVISWSTNFLDMPNIRTTLKYTELGQILTFLPPTFKPELTSSNIEKGTVYYIIKKHNLSDSQLGV